jgi:dipeptidase
MEKGCPRYRASFFCFIDTTSSRQTTIPSSIPEKLALAVIRLKQSIPEHLTKTKPIAFTAPINPIFFYFFPLVLSAR